MNVVIGIVCDVEVQGLTSTSSETVIFIDWYHEDEYHHSLLRKSHHLEYSKSARLFKIDFCFQPHKTSNLLLSSAFHMLIFVVSDTDGYEYEVTKKLRETKEST